MDKSKLVELEKEILSKNEDPKGIFLIKNFRKANLKLRDYVIEKSGKENFEDFSEFLRSYIKENRQTDTELRKLLKDRKMKFESKNEYLINIDS